MPLFFETLRSHGERPVAATKEALRVVSGASLFQLEPIQDSDLHAQWGTRH